MDPVYTSLDWRFDDDYNFRGPRGYVIYKNAEGKLFDALICHGCQCCWQLGDADTINDLGPHFLQFKPREEKSENNV